MRSNRHGRAIVRAAAWVFAAVVVPAALAGTTHEVVAQGSSFIPSDIAVAPGDTVHWTYESGGFHTVTSGTPCTPDNLLFDVALFSGSPQFTWEVPNALPEQVINYFCIPHCPAGMTGTITVEPAIVCPGDVDQSGMVDIVDLLGLLSAWGTNDAKYDIAPAPSGDGVVDIQDLLALLSEWGPCV